METGTGPFLLGVLGVEGSQQSSHRASDTWAGLGGAQDFVG